MAWFLGEMRDVFACVDYPFDENDQTLTEGFCQAFLSVWDEYKERLGSGEMKRSIFCTKVIDRCVSRQELWPPSFTEHRNRLQKAEKEEAIED